MRTEQAQVRALVWTVPNLLSVLRLLTIPLFVWLVLGPQEDGLAALVLFLGGATDFFDGMLARRWDQVSRIGQLLDPIADRLSTLAVLIVFLVRGIVPWWFVALLVGRDVILSIQMARLKSHGVTGLPVNFVGKAATFNLMLSFPLLIWGAAPDSGIEDVARVLGWALALWGAGLYLYSALLYLRQARSVLAGPALLEGA